MINTHRYSQFILIDQDMGIATVVSTTEVFRYVRNRLSLPGDEGEYYCV